MSQFPDLQSVDEISLILKANAVFLEKDWYITKIIHELTDLSDDQFTLVFGGGTSLLKGHQLIERFSEDIDYIAFCQGRATRSQRRTFRRKIVELISSIQDLEIKGEPIIRNEGKFFRVDIAYHKSLGELEHVRREIKLEVSFFDQTHIDQIHCEVTSLMGPFLADRVASVPCVPLIRTASDKISGFCWRMLNAIEKDHLSDETLLRHLYDLNSLKLVIFQQETFDRAIVTFRQDASRVNREELHLNDTIRLVVDWLEENESCKQAYQNFVLNMCFGNSPKPKYEDVVENFKKLIM